MSRNKHRQTVADALRRNRIRLERCLLELDRESLDEAVLLEMEALRGEFIRQREHIKIAIEYIDRVTNRAAQLRKTA